MAAEVGQAYVGISPSLEGFSAKLKSQLAMELRGVSDTVGGEGTKAGRSFGQRFRDGLSEHLSGIGQMLKTGLVVGATAAVAGLAAITSFGLKSAGAMEQTNIGIEALVGNAQEAKKFVADLQQFAAATPFEFSGVADASRRILAFGQAVGITKDQVIPTLTTIGDLVSVLGGGQENIDAVVRAMGQIASTGHLMGGDLLQIAQALPGFDVHAAIAKKLGVSVAEAMKMQEAGEIDATTAISALLDGMKDFNGAAGAMQKQSLTLNGVLSTFKDTIGIALTNAFQPVIPAIKDTITQITPIIGSALDQMAPALGGVLSTLLTLVGSAVQGLAPILTQALGMVQGLLGNGLGDTIAPLGQAIASIFAALAPLAPVIGQLAAALVQALIPLVESLTPLITALVPALISILTPLEPILLQVAQTAGEVLGPVLKLIGAIFLALAPVIGQIIQAIGAALTPILKAIGPVVGKLVDALMPLLPTLIGLIQPALQLIMAFQPLTDIVLQLLIALLPLLDPLVKLVALIINFLAQKAIIPVIQQIADAMAAMLKPVSDLVPWVEKFGNWLNGLNWHHIADEIGGALLDAWHAVTGFFSDAKDWLTKLPGNVKSWLGDFGRTLYDAGGDLVRGLWNGITALGGWLENMLSSFISDHITGPVKRFLGIQSPSTVFAQIGEYTVEGYVQGVTDSARDARAATTMALAPASTTAAPVGLPAPAAAAPTVTLQAGDALMAAFFTAARDHIGNRYGNDPVFAFQRS